MHMQNVPIEGYSSMSTQCAVVLVEVWCEWLVAMWTGRINQSKGCVITRKTTFLFKSLLNYEYVFVNKL